MKKRWWMLEVELQIRFSALFLIKEFKQQAAFKSGNVLLMGRPFNKLCQPKKELPFS